MSRTQDESTRRGRDLLRAGWERLREVQSDQQRGLPVPEPQKPCPPGAERISLRPFADVPTAAITVTEALSRRRSRRRYASTPLTLDELSYLLYASGGLHQTRGVSTLRSAPSAGARHAIETYVAAYRVAGLESAVWRYLPMDHALCQVSAPADLEERATEALHGQGWGCAAAFVWTALPYRMEWRYSVISPKLILLDAGHVCQNLYIACESVGCGTCAIGAYDQKLLDALLGVDGEDELAVYAATVGKV